MYDYIIGKIAELTPTTIILENNGIGYYINISLQSYSALQGKESAKIFIYHHIREEDQQFYGFVEKAEREVFVHLISISGIGPNTARMMLSSLNREEITSAIINNDVNKIKSVKGIGLKTAQRVIIELKDKIGKGSSSATDILAAETNSAITSEATTALVLLGFNKALVEKTIKKIQSEEPAITLESLIKKSLKIL